MIELLLPYPPSINHYWKHWRNRVVISSEGRAYREQVEMMLATMGLSPLQARLSVMLAVSPPDRRRRDMDNVQKALLDAMGRGGVYEDDSQIDLLITKRAAVISGGMVHATVETMPTRHCPLCGR